MWYFLLGFIPFVNVLRAYPLPSFWQEVLALLTFGAWVVHLSLKRAPPSVFRLSWMTVALVLLLGLVVAQSLMGHDSRSGTLIQVVVVLMGGLLVHQTAMRVAAVPCGDLAPVFIPFAWGLVLALVLNLLCVLLATQELELMLYRWVQSVRPDRAGGMFGQPNEFGVFCVLALLGCRYLFYKDKLPATIYCLLCGLAFLGVAASGSRAAFVVWLGVSVLEYMFIKSRNLGVRLFLKKQALFLVVQGSWLLILKNVLTVKNTTEVTVLRGEFGARYEQYRDAFVLFRENPFLGVGWGKTAEARFFDLNSTLMEPNATHLHNFIADLSVELGVGGLLVSLIMIYGVWVACAWWKESRLGIDERIFAASFLLGILLYGLFEYPFWYVYFLYAFLFIAGLISTPFVVEFNGIKIDRHLSLFAAFIVLVCGLGSALDYYRIQFGLMHIADEINGFPASKISEADVLTLRRSTLFVNQIDNIWLDISDYRDGAAQLKLPVADRLFRKTPSAGAAIQLVAYAIEADQPERAAQVLDRFKQGNPGMYLVIVRELARMAVDDPRIKRFLLSHDVIFRDEP